MNQNKERVKTGIIGIGRIGQVHLDNLLSLQDLVEVTAVCDPSQDTRSYILARGISLVTDSYEELIESEGIEALLICSPTPTHVPIIQKAAMRGLHIFCEKPVDISLDKIRETIEMIDSAEIKFQVGFNRRFDNHFRRAKEKILNGNIGQIQMLKITSRDPTPPSMEYIHSSGGLFMDMTIHDFDMARYMMNSEIREVYATGRVLIDPALEDLGDIDTAMIILGFENGSLAQIDNSRKAIYGYDQRLEAFGSEGMLEVGNVAPDTLSIHDTTGKRMTAPNSFFMDRYPQSYRDEIVAFFHSILKDADVQVGLEDAYQACTIALACNKSMKEKRLVLTTEIARDQVK